MGGFLRYIFHTQEPKSWYYYYFLIIGGFKNLFEKKKLVKMDIFFFVKMATKTHTYMQITHTRISIYIIIRQIFSFCSFFISFSFSFFNFLYFQMSKLVFKVWWFLFFFSSKFAKIMNIVLQHFLIRSEYNI